MSLEKKRNHEFPNMSKYFNYNINADYFVKVDHFRKNLFLLL